MASPDLAAASRGGTPHRGSLLGGELRLGVAGALDLRWAAVDVRATLEEARRRHDLSPISTTALGRVIAGAALLRALATRACRRLTLTISGDGPLGEVIAEARDTGDLRGFVGEPRVDLPDRADGRLPIAAAIGRGRLKVFRELADGSRSESQVALRTGEIGLDLAHYLEQSEQVQSAITVGTLLGPEGVRAAGGLLVEVIPAARSEPIARVEANLAAFGSVSQRLAREGIDGVVAAALEGIEWEPRESGEVRFRCGCSRADLLPRLAGLAQDDLLAIADAEGRITAQCAYCATAYVFDLTELGSKAPPNAD